MTSKKRLISEIERSSKVLHTAAEQAEYWYNQYVEALEKEHKAYLARIDQQKQLILRKARSEHKDTLSRTNRRLEKVVNEAGLIAAAWDDAAWRSWKPAAVGFIPRLTRIGRLFEEAHGRSFIAPALLPIIGGRNVVIKATGAGKDVARHTIQSVMLRLLTTIRPGKLRFTCIDPVGLGTTMAGLIKGLPEMITGGQAWFDTHEIEQRLADLEKHIANVKQKYLGLSFPDMEAYNAEAGAVAESYRLLVVADFPARFTESAAQRLLSIATNGPGAGVYVLIMVDAEQKPPHSFRMDDLERTGTVLNWRGDGVIWQDPDFESCRLEPDVLPSRALFDHLVKIVGDLAVAEEWVKVPFKMDALSLDHWRRHDSSYGLSVPIGQRGARETRLFELDEKLLSSGLVIGRTGSGKSTLLHVIILSLALHYPPDELELYLVDFKQVEFKDYATLELPHARVVAVQSEREFGLSVLRRLDAELKFRMDLLGDLGFQSFSEYRERTRRRMPRILFIADEFQELFSENDILAAEAGLILDRIVRMGRAFGINTLLASQTLAGQYSLSRSTKDQIPLRIALQCSEGDSRLILSDENDRARLLERPGEALYNNANGRIEGNDFFQIFWLTNDEREEYLQQIAALVAKKPALSPEPQIVFDGNAPADILTNHELAKLLSESTPNVRKHSYAAWLGEPVEIKEHTAAVFRRQSGSNLLVIGQNEYELKALAMLLSAMLSLAAQHQRENARFIIINLSDVDTPWHDLPLTLADAIPHAAEIVRKRDAIEAIEQLSVELAHRTSIEDEDQLPTLYLVVIGLHRLRSLRREDSYYPQLNEVKSPGVQFEEICRDGPEVGIHTLVWCDTYSNLERVMDRGPVKHFDLRVVLQTNADDSRRLLDTDAASRLGPHWALYWDEERTARAEKFRPYGLPDAQWLKDLGMQLGTRK